MDRGTRQEVVASMQAGLGRALPLLGWGLAAFYAALTVNWAVALQPAYPVLGGAWAASAVLLAGLTLAAGTTRSPLLRRTLPDLMAAVVLAASLLLLGATRDPALTLALYITVLGFGLVLASRLSLLLVVGTAAGGWLAIALASGGPGWPPRGIALAACCLTAVASQAVRIRLTTRLVQAHRRELAAVRTVEEARRLQAEMETKSAFIRLAAHELATPLTTVTLQARVLARANLPEAQARAAHLLDRNVERLNRLMRDVITVTQYQAGVVVSAPRRVALADLVRERAATLPPSARPVLQVEDALEVEADRDRLGDAVQRLLENAARRGGAQPPEATVRREGGEAVVAVRDHGPALAPERVAALFRPFSIDPNAVPDGTDGVGLGLAVARLHVEAQGGRIGYAPAEPGSVFSIRLPLPAPTGAAPA